MKTLPTLGLLCLFALPVFADEVRTPKPGTKERTEILDAIRDPLEDLLHQKVTFRVSHLKVKDDWAFLMAEARTPDDKPIDYKGTMFEDEAVELDEGVIAILRRKRDRWYVVERTFFAGDVWWHSLREPLRAPKEIFPDLQKEQ